MSECADDVSDMHHLMRFLSQRSPEQALHELAGAPYNLRVKKKDDGRVLLNYDQVKSDMRCAVVRACRGVILHHADCEAAPCNVNGGEVAAARQWRVLCAPFERFFNLGESHVDFELDWNDAYVLHKEDGSLIKMYFYNGEWVFATRGTIDAGDALVDSGDASSTRRSFSSIVHDAIDALDGGCCFDWAFFDAHRDKTFLFELLSPLTQVVVFHERPQLVHIGTRCARTFREFALDELAVPGVRQPRRYELRSAEACRLFNEAHGGATHEGFVVCQRQSGRGGRINRVKVKSAAYLALHRLGTSNLPPNFLMLNAVLLNEVDELLSVRPRWSEAARAMREQLDAYIRRVSNRQQALQQEAQRASGRNQRKAFAKLLGPNDWQSLHFALLNDPALDVRGYIVTECAGTSRALKKLLGRLQAAMP